MVRCMSFCLLLLVAAPALAFKCYVTAMKDSCWDDYDVTIKVMNSATKKELASDIVLKKGALKWQRVSFDCEPQESLYYSATFTPEIWEGGAGKVYYSQRYWNLPKAIKKGELAWNINLCFPKEFSQVPLPPNVSGQCKCDFNSVPEIKLKKQP